MILCEGHGSGIVPAVDDFFHAVHLLSADGAFDGDIIHIGTVQFDILRTVVRHASEFFHRADAVPVSAPAFPNRKRRSPVSVAGDRPILDVLQPVSETLLADSGGAPVYRRVIAQQVIPYRGHLDIPGLPRVINQGRVAAPAVRITVGEFRCGEQKLSVFQILKDKRIRLLHESAYPWRGLSHLSLGIHILQEGKIIFESDLIVVFTESRCDVDDAGAFTEGDIVRQGDIMSLAVDFLEGEQRLVLSVFQIFSLNTFKYGPAFSQHAFQQAFCQPVSVSVRCFHLHIIQFRVNAQRHIAGQSPGGGGPGEEIGVFIFAFEADHSGTLRHVLVSLSDLVGSQRRSAAGAVRYDPVSLIQEPPVPDLFQRPPFTLDVVILICDIGMIHICPETDGGGEILPHPLIFPDALLALVDKGRDTVSLDVLLALKAKELLHFQLHRQAVRVPARLAGDSFALHGVVAGNHILDDPGEDVPDMRFSVGRRGTVIEHVDRAVLAVLDTLFEDPVIFPELLDLLFLLDEIPVGVYLFVHIFLL